MKRYLLDTHIVLWGLTAPRKLGRATRHILEHEAVRCFEVFADPGAEGVEGEQVPFWVRLAVGRVLGRDDRLDEGPHAGV